MQVLSMSRLGGAAAVAPLVANMSSEVPLNPISKNYYMKNASCEFRIGIFIFYTSIFKKN